MRRVVLLLFCACSAEIEHGLDEAAANEIVLTLGRAGIRAEKEAAPGTRSSFSVSVPSRSVGRALETLRAQGLPRTPEVGLEVFDEPGWIPTSIEERARYEHAVAGELARSIESLKGVLDARVHVAVPGRDPLAASDGPAPKPRASVLIQVDGAGSPIDEDDLRALVTGAVDGLSPSEVRVVVARRTTPKPVPAAPSGRVVSVAWLGASTAVIAALAVALLVSISRTRSTRRRARTQGAEGRTE